MPTPTLSRPSFQVNPVNRADGQNSASVAALADGRFAAVYRNESDPKKLNFIIYNADGTVNRAESIANSNPATGGNIPEGQVSIAALDGGGFAIAWSSRNAAGNHDIYHRVYNAAGVAVTGDILSNSDVVGGQEQRPEIVSDRNGGFYMVWEDRSFDREPGPEVVLTPTVRLKHFNANGQALGPSERIPDMSGGDWNASVAVNQNGTRVNVVWDDDVGTVGNDSSDGIRGHESTGGLGDYRVDSGDFSEFHADPDVSYSTGNNFMTVWTEYVSVGVYRVHGAVNGGPEFRINTSNTNAFAEPKVIGLDTGNFLVVWNDGGLDGNDDVMGQLYSVTGQRIGSEFRISDRASTYVAGIDLSKSLDGRVIVTWTSSAPGSASEIFARVVDPRQGPVDWVGTGYSEQFVGTAFADRLDGRAGNDQLYGEAGADRITGGLGNDKIDGGLGADTMLGGAGNDVYIVDNADDIVDERAAGSNGVDTVQASVHYTLGTGVENLTLTGTVAINGTGNNLANVIVGNAAANTLNGGTGADRLSGGGGNDIYVTDGGDVIYEAAYQGTDTVRSSVSYALGANLENLVLTGPSAINGTGNSLANVIYGNAAANVLNGATGADRLYGGGGNDIYVTDGGDIIYEAAYQGTDTVQSRVTYTLGANLENLTLTGGAAINGTGNTLNNVITGNGAANVLNGGTGADRLVGGAGNDTYITDGGDVIYEAANQGTDTVQSRASHTLSANVENLVLVNTATALNGIGNALANSITGNNYNNKLAGGGGNDTLRGGLGNDVFVFDTAIGAANRDTIVDFSNVSGNNDTFQLDNAVFTRLGAAGALNTSFFKAGTTAQDANDYIVYNKATGALYYDADGSGGGAAVQIATLSNRPTLTAGDFVVI